MNDQLKSATTKCRSAKSYCDLPEYCDGKDHLCPSDVYRRNTDKCTVNGVCCHTALTLYSNILPAFAVCLTIDVKLTDHANFGAPCI